MKKNACTLDCVYWQSDSIVWAKALPDCRKNASIYESNQIHTCKEREKEQEGKSVPMMPSVPVVFDIVTKQKFKKNQEEKKDMRV